MRKQQIILVGGGLILVLIIFLFGNTIPPKTTTTTTMPSEMAKQPALTTDEVLASGIAKLPTEIQSRINQQTKSVSETSIKEEKITEFKQLASFWSDSAQNLPLSAYFKGEAAKLENSEKNLTFAGRKLLSYVLVEQSQPMQTWMATNAKDLFEQALKINPDNDSTLVGLGACYMFGNISDNPMQEIMRVRNVAEKHPENMYAQMMLGLGGVKSGQYDNAIKRFLIVVKNQPDNLEAIFNLAETYDRLEDKPNAIKWYEKAQKMIQVPEAKKEISQRIEALSH